MPAPLQVALAQLDPIVGGVAANAATAIDAANRARDQQHCDLIIFPELFLCGYPPEDLLLHAGLRNRVNNAIDALRQVDGITMIVGYPEYDGDNIYNSAAVFRDGEIIAHYRKHLLPNYRVFDEKRYFTPGDKACVFTQNGLTVGVTICEDIWHQGPVKAATDAGAEIIVSINGSPYQIGSQSNRESVAAERIRTNAVPIVYVNMVGGQDELVFDGGSFVMDAAGELLYRAGAFDETVDKITIDKDAGKLRFALPQTMPLASLQESVYGALVTGTRDYVDKHNFPGIVLGLSGGIDSALTMAIAVDALGAERVQAVMMPYHYTADISKHDAAEQAKLLGVNYQTISIEPMVKATLQQLNPLFAGLAEDATEENIQSRCRGVLLMAISNKTGRMVLTTGNKSEMAVGYATLYGDMAGGFAPIKDCSKTLVYQLARYRNSLSPAIPERVIEREPSAELRPDQRDTDSLPAYDILDPILDLFVVEDLSVEQICERGFDRTTVIKILSMVRRNEYKRRQAPPGVRISGRAFGRDWRYPITSGYRFPGE